MQDVISHKDTWSRISLSHDEKIETCEKLWRKRIAEAETIEQRAAIRNCLEIYRKFHP